MKSAKTDVNGCTIWCQIFGSGSKPLLMIPGLLGTGTTDFNDQVYGDDALDLSQFTIVCVELPGWGRSRPPLRNYGPDVYENDAKCCFELMKSLGYDKFSVLGWSEGARVGLVLGKLYPSSIEKIILLSVVGQQSEEEINRNIELFKDVNKWNQKVLNNYLRAYEDIHEIQGLLNQFLQFLREMPNYFKQGLFNNIFNSIICPVLVIHGDKDPLITLEDCFLVFIKLKNAKIKRFPNGSHNLHQIYKREFKQIVENFLIKK